MDNGPSKFNEWPKKAQHSGHHSQRELKKKAKADNFLHKGTLKYGEFEARISRLLQARLWQGIHDLMMALSRINCKMVPAVCGFKR